MGIPMMTVLRPSYTTSSHFLDLLLDRNEKPQAQGKGGERPRKVISQHDKFNRVLDRMTFDFSMGILPMALIH